MNASYLHGQPVGFGDGFPFFHGGELSTNSQYSPVPTLYSIVFWDGSKAPGCCRIVISVINGPATQRTKVLLFVPVALYNDLGQFLNDSDD
jgi:hypothetical protein